MRHVEATRQLPQVTYPLLYAAVQIAGPEDLMTTSAANEAPVSAAGKCESPKDPTTTGTANEAPVSAAGQCGSPKDPKS